MSRFFARPTPFMEKASLGPGPSKNGQTVLKKAVMASQTTSDPVVFGQPNIVMPFVAIN
jgi:hypothetical protein